MILKSFVQYLTFEKRYSEHTIKAYVSDIEQFQSFLGRTFDVSNLLEVTPTFLRSWMVELMNEGTAVRSIRRKHSVLNTFFQFAIKQEMLVTNPMEKVLVPKLQKKLPAYLRQSEVEMLESILPAPTSFGAARDAAIILTLVHTGMRRAELIAMRTEDVDIDARTLRVMGKRKKQRIVPITEALSDLLKTYLDFRQAFDNESESFFLTDKGRALYPKYVYNLVKRYLESVTTLEGKGPHTLRHTFATLMLNAGADINAIKELLGHADLNATQVYTHTSIEKLKDAYKKSHPKAEVVR